MAVEVDTADVRKIAAEGWVYGYALLENYRTMYPQAVAASDHRYVGGFGVFRHYSQPFTPANTDVVTPNNDTPYSWAWLDLRAEPWVVSVPAIDRYYVLPLHDLDTSYVGFIGARTTGQAAGDYLVAGPGWDGPVPDRIAGVLRADTFLVGVLGRTYLAGRQDIGALQAIQQQYLLQPLSTFLGTPPPDPAPSPAWPVWKEDVLGSIEFFSYLDFLLQFFPVLPDEAELRARLASVGVQGKGTFNPAALTEPVRAAIGEGIADGQAALTAAAATADNSTGWFGTRTQHGHDYLTRAVGVDKGLYGLPAEEAWYAGWLTDSEGQRPDAGKHGYTIHFPAGQLPPAQFFWSATMYRLPQRLLVDNPVDRYSIGDRTPGIVYAPDGALTLYVQAAQPVDPDQTANWLPAPDGLFTIAIRVYGPDAAVLNGQWKMPALTPHPVPSPG